MHNQSKITEAQNWQINRQGRIELIANISRKKFDFEQKFHQCSPD